MHLISYNVNGIRSSIRKGMMQWLHSASPEVVCFQELKVQSDQIPSGDFESLGYHTFWFPAQKRGYSGEGIIARRKPDAVILGMGIDRYDQEGRMIRADFGDVSVLLEIDI